jgi:hypothetical protein
MSWSRYFSVLSELCEISERLADQDQLGVGRERDAHRVGSAFDQIDAFLIPAQGEGSRGILTVVFGLLVVWQLSCPPFGLIDVRGKEVHGC